MMTLTGKFCGLTRDYATGKPCLIFRVNEDLHDIEDYEGKDLSIKITKLTRHRSLDANSYFHLLCDRLRLKLGISMAHMKNILITSYGQIEYIEEGQSLIYKTNAPIEYIQELEEAHMKFLKMSEEGAYYYKVYRGSHTYNTQEMHQLIAGTIEEAKAQGIEVVSAEELAKMESLWKGR